jgi:outer membrane receptor for ferric coprogen and ferric-rhodotorulic acid
VRKGFFGSYVYLTTAAALGLACPPGAQAQAGPNTGKADVIVVIGTENTSTATGLGLTLRETPQSVTIIDAKQIDEFGLSDANQLLAMAPGINVEKVETDRTYYNSRGFDITNFQLDGIGMPLIWGIQFGDLDTAIFERVEAIRGANGMMTGTGNPSATINYIRKRPGAAFAADASVQYGSWDDLRFEADITGPLTSDGAIRGRLVYANEDKDSYLDDYRVNRNVYYGTLAWDLTSQLTATVGYSLQDNRAKGVLWGALPLLYSDGTPIDYPTSASTSADWTYWNVRDQSAFGELSYEFGNGWEAKGVYTYRRFDERAKLLYASGYPDPGTGLGVVGTTGVYPSFYNQQMLDLVAKGPFALFGRQHELVVGINASRAHGTEYEAFSPDVFDYPPVSEWGHQQIAEPTYPDQYLSSNQTDLLYRAYAASHLNLTDKLKAVVGFSAISLKSHGFSYGEDTPRDEQAVSPYVGAVYDLNGNVSLYASYTDIFNPQSEVDVNHQTLAAAKGKSYEAGVKSEWFGQRLYATASVFESEQSNLADFAGTFSDGKSYYAGIDTKVQGYELEVSGLISPQWSVAGGWTDLSIEGEDGKDVRTYLPRRTFKLSTTYAFPKLRDLKFGAALRWQDDIHVEDIVTIPQDAYAVLDLMAGINLTQHAKLTLNLKNVTNEKYFTSLQWGQSFYAPPRSVYLKLDYAF